MRLIDADALKETMSDLDCESNNADFQSGMEFIMRDFMPKVIDAQPTIDAQPVQHGRWIDWSMWGDSKYECSECDCETKHRTNFCPNCGARMDGGADNG